MPPAPAAAAAPPLPPRRRLPPLALLRALNVQAEWCSFHRWAAPPALNTPQKPPHNSGFNKPAHLGMACRAQSVARAPLGRQLVNQLVVSHIVSIEQLHVRCVLQHERAAVGAAAAVGQRQAGSSGGSVAGPATSAIAGAGGLQRGASSFPGLCSPVSPAGLAPGRRAPHARPSFRLPLDRGMLQVTAVGLYSRLVAGRRA